MVFIVSDQRIATENFEKGKIYKVVFLDESIFYGVCLGIGSNFVMLSGNISGYLFPLTMETASQVESIDLFDPTPPEPPVPWTNLLQYQTGEPPFTFNTTDDQLFSWYITGAGVGDKTANLCFKIISNANISESGDIRTLSGFDLAIAEVEQGQKYSGTGYIYAFFENEPTIGDISYNQSRTLGSLINITAPIAGYVAIRIQNTNNPMINAGSTILDYEPYGYKIPIVCGGQTTNMYIDNPLGADDILYSTQTGIQIPTIVGDNTLSVNTTVQPSEMQIVYKIADR